MLHGRDLVLFGQSALLLVIERFSTLGDEHDRASAIAEPRREPPGRGHTTAPGVFHPIFMGSRESSTYPRPNRSPSTPPRGASAHPQKLESQRVHLGWRRRSHPLNGRQKIPNCPDHGIRQPHTCHEGVPKKRKRSRTVAADPTTGRQGQRLSIRTGLRVFSSALATVML